MQPVTQLPSYSLMEVERRWLADVTAAGSLADAPCRLYDDLYLHDSRLRLRKITESNGSVLYKLGKKYGKRSRLCEPITTLYLTEAEYGPLASLRGHRLIKHRYTLAGGSLDVYHHPRDGLMIFELEFDDEAAAESIGPRAS